MKKLVSLLFITISGLTVFGQNETTFKNDTLTLSTGFKITEGDKVKIGIGSANDGAFNFIRVSSNSLFQTYSPNGLFTRESAANNALPAKYSGFNLEVKKIEKRGNIKRGYVYYVMIKTGGTIGITGTMAETFARYEIDIENAIAKEEIIVPEDFKSKLKITPVVVEVKQQFSLGDELTKLKKLLDDGILTKEEYDTQKKKLLERN